MAHFLTTKHFMDRLSLLLLFGIFLISGCVNVAETMLVNGVEIKKIGQEKGFSLQAIEVAILASETEGYFFIYDDDLYSQL